MPSGKLKHKDNKKNYSLQNIRVKRGLSYVFMTPCLTNYLDFNKFPSRETVLRN